MSNYSVYIADNGAGQYAVVAINTPTTLPAGGTRLSIPWVFNPNAGTTNLTVSTATNATPIVVTTSTAHGYSTGDEVFISGALVNTAANGAFTITVTSTTAFSLDQSVGNGSYTASSAVVKKLTKATDFKTVLQAATRAILNDVASGN